MIWIEKADLLNLIHCKRFAFHRHSTYNDGITFVILFYFIDKYKVNKSCVHHYVSFRVALFESLN